MVFRGGSCPTSPICLTTEIFFSGKNAGSLADFAWQVIGYEQVEFDLFNLYRNSQCCVPSVLLKYKGTRQGALSKIDFAGIRGVVLLWKQQTFYIWRCNVVFTEIFCSSGIKGFCPFHITLAGYNVIQQV